MNRKKNGGRHSTENHARSRAIAAYRFHGLTQGRHLGLEAVEMLIRSEMHQAGAVALTELLRLARAGATQHSVQLRLTAQYRELRCKSILTAVGLAEVSRPYYLCPNCHQGQFPADQKPDIVDTEFSPGVRARKACWDRTHRFDHGREQLKLLAGLEVTTKSVERVAEAIGEDIALR